MIINPFCPAEVWAAGVQRESHLVSQTQIRPNILPRKQYFLSMCVFIYRYYAAVIVSFGNESKTVKSERDQSAAGPGSFTVINCHGSSGTQTCQIACCDGGDGDKNWVPTGLISAFSGSWRTMSCHLLHKNHLLHVISHCAGICFRRADLNLLHSFTVSFSELGRRKRNTISLQFIF